jgi:class 3 adenylate cyclase
MTLVVPVFDTFVDPHKPANATVVGHLFAIIPWATYFKDMPVEDTEKIAIQISSPCGTVVRVVVHGHEVDVIDVDEWDSSYDEMFISHPFGDFVPTTCNFTVTAYPTAEFEEEYVVSRKQSNSNDFSFFTIPQHSLDTINTTLAMKKTNVPWIYVAVVSSFMVVTCCGFLVFDQRVFSRQQQLIDTATKQNAIVSSLFPKSVHKQLMEHIETPEGNKKNNKSGTAHLRSYLMEEATGAKQPKDGGESTLPSKPIADLFPETTIMFADIAGFTAWSSVREPSQVFTLLESIYREFDSIAKRRRVFKVEVVGDCYVAVSGLPDPRLDHALVMAKFAKDCLNAMRRVCASLEVTLGPDTTELNLRVGMHSGPVVAGVLRGDKSRFQLFGDTVSDVVLGMLLASLFLPTLHHTPHTSCNYYLNFESLKMNTASRMESTGVPGRIQVSKETAKLLSDAGKQNWLVQRENKVQAKGKGELTTFFLEMESKASDTASQTSNESGVDSAKDELLYGSIANAQEEIEKKNRIAEWTVEVLAKVLKSIVSERKAFGIKPDSGDAIEKLEVESLSQNYNKKTVIDEVAEMVLLPGYRAKKKEINENCELEDKIMMQLRHYVQTIASVYNDNPFHNFDHANHVVMSVNKLLGRINAPDLDVDDNGKMLYDHTYGITSDPLTW